jgi:hypothetical protein
MEKPMEILLAIVVFGILGVVTLYGYGSSNRASRRSGRPGQDRPAAGVTSR